MSENGTVEEDPPEPSSRSSTTMNLLLGVVVLLVPVLLLLYGWGDRSGQYQFHREKKNLFRNTPPPSVSLYPVSPPEIQALLTEEERGYGVDIIRHSAGKEGGESGDSEDLEVSQVLQSISPPESSIFEEDIAGGLRTIADRVSESTDHNLISPTTQIDTAILIYLYSLDAIRHENHRHLHGWFQEFHKLAEGALRQSTFDGARAGLIISDLLYQLFDAIRFHANPPDRALKQYADQIRSLRSGPDLEEVRATTAYRAAFLSEHVIQSGTSGPMEIPYRFSFEFPDYLQNRLPLEGGTSRLFPGYTPRPVLWRNAASLLSGLNALKSDLSLSKENHLTQDDLNRITGVRERATSDSLGALLPPFHQLLRARIWHRVRADLRVLAGYLITHPSFPEQIPGSVRQLNTGVAPRNPFTGDDYKLEVQPEQVVLRGEGWKDEDVIEVVVPRN